MSPVPTLVRRASPRPEDAAHLCARAGCWRSRLVGRGYCSAQCEVADRMVVRRLPPPALERRSCRFNAKHAYAVRAGQVDAGYCRPACAAAAARLAMRREATDA